MYLHFVAYWIAHRAIKAVYDHEDGLNICPHDISTVKNKIYAFFKVSKLYMHMHIEIIDVIALSYSWKENMIF